MHADVNAPGPALNLIVVEDSELDYELLLAMLMREGLRPRAVRVEDEAGLRAAFAAGPIDAVITDHNLPRFDSFASIKVAKSVDSDIPVIVLSGEMSEELAVATLHAGADDFVLKTRMFRIAAALQNSLRAAAARRESRATAAALAESEARLHALTQHLERAKEDERRAIAQEIHDDIGGALTALKFEVVRLSRELEARDGSTASAWRRSTNCSSRRSSPATASSTRCGPPSSTRDWSRRSSGWRAASASAAASRWSSRATARSSRSNRTARRPSIASRTRPSPTCASTRGKQAACRCSSSRWPTRSPSRSPTTARVSTPRPSAPVPVSAFVE